MSKKNWLGSFPRNKIALGVKAGFVLAVWKNLLLCFIETNMKCHNGEKLF